MTGTGTQEDPFIVDNWADFMSITNKDNRYIEWDRNSADKVVDFNEIRPQGYSSTVSMGRYTKYNGWIFRNFYSTAINALNFGDAGKTIGELNFENFYWQVPSGASYFLTCSTNGDYKSVFDNCVFSGKIAVSGADVYFCSEYLSRCAMNIEVSCSANRFDISRYDIENSDIVLDIITDKKCELTYYNAVNSRFSGKISASSVSLNDSSGSGYNIYNLESDQPLKYIGNGISVYNSDLATASEDGTGMLKPCTSAQLKDINYLKSIGFPIGAE